MATSAANGQEFIYLPNGPQATMSICCGGTVTYSYYSTDWQDLEDDAGGGSVATYVWGLENQSELVERDDPSGNRLYAQHDANMDVTALVNTSGSVVERFSYTPNGIATVLTPSWTSTTDSYNWIFRWQGGKYNATNGLYTFGYRDYSPTLGTWLEEDPSGYAAGPNVYQAMLGAPIEKTDPYGLQAAPTTAPATSTSAGAAPTTSESAPASTQPATSGAGPSTWELDPDTHRWIPIAGPAARQPRVLLSPGFRIIPPASAQPTTLPTTQPTTAPGTVPPAVVVAPTAPLPGPAAPASLGPIVGVYGFGGIGGSYGIGGQAGLGLGWRSGSGAFLGGEAYAWLGLPDGPYVGWGGWHSIPGVGPSGSGTGPVFGFGPLEGYYDLGGDFYGGIGGDQWGAGLIFDGDSFRHLLTTTIFAPSTVRGPRSFGK